MNWNYCDWVREFLSLGFYFCLYFLIIFCTFLSVTYFSFSVLPFPLPPFICFLPFYHSFFVPFSLQTHFFIEDTNGPNHFGKCFSFCLGIFSGSPPLFRKTNKTKIDASWMDVRDLYCIWIRDKRVYKLALRVYVVGCPRNGSYWQDIRE